MNSPATFQMMMNTIFHTEVAQGWLSIYTDDIAIHTKHENEETEQQHLKRHRLYTHHMLHKLEHPETQPKFTNFLDLQATTNTSSKGIQKSHAHYSTSPRKQSSGTGENHNIRPSKSSKHACAHALFLHNQISTNHSFFRQTRWPMAWAPYSRKRVNTMQFPPKNPNYIQLHSTLQLSHPPNETTTSTNKNSLR